ncbi:MAG: hypothetical protein II726_01850, partial [Elusimicrobiaceae bacterium]|nr:hypothetical protein [Elusimicrobiaceae bacterium]
TLDIEGLIARLEALEKGETNDITPSSSSNNQAEEKLETKPIQEPKKIEVKQETKTPKAETAKEDTTPFNPVTALPVLKNALAETSPSLDDALRSSKVNFVTPENWVVEVENYFAKNTCDRRKKDIEGIALKLFKRKINFEFNVSAREAALQSPRYVEVLKQTSPITTAKPEPVKQEELISKEEPFSMQDFSPKTEVKAGEVTQNILNLFDGQIISTKDENA